MRSFSKKHWLFLIVMLLGAAFLAGGSILFLRMRRESRAEAVIDGIEPAAVIQEVGKLIELPTEEQPSIAIVRDVKKLQDQEIFRKAKNGDILLIYVRAKRAYLYDREAGKLVDVAPVNLQNESPLPQTGQ